MGVSSFDTVKANHFIGPPPTMTSGQVYYVSNVSTAAALAPGAIGGSDGNDGKSPQTPFSTLDYAIGQCSASRGDVIYVLPGHAETISGAAGVAIDVAGVSVIGLGRGSLRPTFNFTATASTITMSAANCSVQNLLFTGGVDAVVSYLVISAADCKVLNCEYRDVTGQCTDGILTTAAADRLEIAGLRHDGAVAAGTNAAIAIVGGDRISIHDCDFDGNFAVGCIDIRTTATTDLEVHKCKARTRNAADIFIVDTITASTGTIGPSLYLRLQDNAANITEACTGVTFVYHNDISIVNLAGELGMLTNITASTDA
jgi:hypothetical protein